MPARRSGLSQRRSTGRKAESRNRPRDADRCASACRTRNGPARKKGTTLFEKDEANRPDTTMEGLARLKPAFRPNGTITARNAPGLNDAASAGVVADGVWADKVIG
jgi:acetyl-CoA acetyltransferase